jgi:hypothetical protein
MSRKILRLSVSIFGLIVTKDYGRQPLATGIFLTRLVLRLIGLQPPKHRFKKGMESGSSILMPKIF